MRRKISDVRKELSEAENNLNALAKQRIEGDSYLTKSLLEQLALLTKGIVNNEDKTPDGLYGCEQFIGYIQSYAVGHTDKLLKRTPEVERVRILKLELEHKIKYDGRVGK